MPYCMLKCIPSLRYSENFNFRNVRLKIEFEIEKEKPTTKMIKNEIILLQNVESFFLRGYV